MVRSGREVDEQQAAERKVQKIQHAVVGMTISSAFQPITNSKILIQLGYEPLPLMRGRSLLIAGADKQFLPNVFKYTHHLYREHGLHRLYTGVKETFTGNLVAFFVSHTVTEYINQHYPTTSDDVEIDDIDDERTALKTVAVRLGRQSVARTAGIICSRPFQVLVIRKVAQIIGEEADYPVNTIIALFRVNKTEGFPGLFSGVIPQLIGEMCIFWSSHMLVHAFERLWRKYVKEEQSKEGKKLNAKDESELNNMGGMIKQFVRHAVPFVASGFFYPYQLVSTVMAVNGSNLSVGGPPYFPIFLNWQDCYDYLKSRSQLKRGSKLFFRAYEGRTAFRNGAIYAVQMYRDFPF